MPASTPALVLIGGELPSPQAEIVGSNGRVVGAAVGTSGGYVFIAPEVPLAPGRYTVRTVKASCGSTVSTPFEVTAAVPLPTAAGNLRVVRRYADNVYVDSVSAAAASCTEPIAAGVVDLAIDVDKDTAPYGSVLVWETYVDGELWGTDLGDTPSTLSSLRIYTTCGTVPRSARARRLSEGPHTVEVRPRLLGATQPIAPASISIDLSCDPLRSEEEAATEGCTIGRPLERCPVGASIGVPLALGVVLVRRRARTARRAGSR